MIAATLSGPSASMVRSTSSAHAQVQPSAWSHHEQRYGCGIGHVPRAGHQRLVRVARGGQAGDGERAHRRAVVGIAARDRLVSPREAAIALVRLRHLERRFDRLGTARHEEGARPLARRRDFRQPLREHRARHIREREGRNKVDLLQLRDHRLDDLAAPVADIDAEEPGEAVDVLVAVRVPDVAPLPAHDDGRVRQPPALGELAHLREVQPDIVGNRAAQSRRFPASPARRPDDGRSSVRRPPEQATSPQSAALPR